MALEREGVNKKNWTQTVGQHKEMVFIKKVFQGMLSIFYIFLIFRGRGFAPPPLIGDISPKSRVYLTPSLREAAKKKVHPLVAGQLILDK